MEAKFLVDLSFLVTDFDGGSDGSVIAHVDDGGEARAWIK
ncbi:hypothetical protein A2U01_0105528, partial [Trifolium medium]|nr:hypothetical protein [Trifolium medium]